MKNRTLLIYLGLGVCIMLVVLSAYLFLAPASLLTSKIFWIYKLMLLLFAIAACAYCIGDIGGRSNEKGLPLRMTKPIIGFGYLAFTLYMCVAGNFETETLILVQGTGFLIAVICWTIISLGISSVNANAAAYCSGRIVKESFKLNIECIIFDNSKKIDSSPAVHKAMRQLIDAATYTSESLPGTEAIDSEISHHINLLSADFATTDNVEALLPKVIFLHNQFTKRQLMLKQLRH